MGLQISIVFISSSGETILYIPKGYKPIEISANDNVVRVHFIGVSEETPLIERKFECYGAYSPMSLKPKKYIGMCEHYIKGPNGNSIGTPTHYYVFEILKQETNGN